ncbi:UNVERIFIED_CONTAM: hypothetical protein Sradi_1895900 [Sesamum radiatum]|uniref:Uncharacterized protein n=1 Tax=Sesamum radiatum TaxID=300843 RepID=A0AAW2TX46_SESRA
MSSINSQRLDAGNFIAECYSVATYLRVYERCTMPMDGSENWHHTDLPSLMPPNIARGVGRPARARRVEQVEVPLKQKKRDQGKGKQVKLKRQQDTIKCKFCEDEGHNKKVC